MLGKSNKQVACQHTSISIHNLYHNDIVRFSSLHVLMSRKTPQPAVLLNMASFRTSWSCVRTNINDRSCFLNPEDKSSRVPSNDFSFKIVHWKERNNYNPKISAISNILLAVKWRLCASAWDLRLAIRPRIWFLYWISWTLNETYWY